MFALLAGDISMPVTFNLGRFGWTPTVQLTALTSRMTRTGLLPTPTRATSRPPRTRLKSRSDACAVPAAEFVLLVKPQFEAGPEQVGRGGVVRGRP